MVSSSGSRAWSSRSRRSGASPRPRRRRCRRATGRTARRPRRTCSSARPRGASWPRWPPPSRSSSACSPGRGAPTSCRTSRSDCAAEMAPGPMTMADGGLETSLIFHEGFDLPAFAAFVLREDDRGRGALRRYYEPFLDLAQELGLAFVLDTATWRASPDWGAQLGYDADALAAVNASAVALGRELAAGRRAVIVNGVLG